MAPSDESGKLLNLKMKLFDIPSYTKKMLRLYCHSKRVAKEKITYLVAPE